MEHHLLICFVNRFSRTFVKLSNGCLILELTRYIFRLSVWFALTFVFFEEHPIGFSQAISQCVTGSLKNTWAQLYFSWPYQRYRSLTYKLPKGLFTPKIFSNTLFINKRMMSSVNRFKVLRGVTKRSGSHKAAVLFTKRVLIQFLAVFF